MTYKNHELKLKIDPTIIKMCDEIKNNHINLLVLKENDKINGINGHLILIKNFNGLMSGKSKNKILFCMRCLCPCTKTQKLSCDEVLQEHLKLCLKNKNPTREMFPSKKSIKGKNGKIKEPNNIIQFKNFKNAQELPFFIYADLESILIKHNDVKKNTTKYQYHKPVSFCIYLVSKVEQIKSELILKVDVKCIDKLFETLNSMCIRLNGFLKTNIKMTDFDEKSFKNSTECHICNKEFTEKDIKVRDHNHLNGKYRGAAHQSCNLNFNLKKIKIPVVFHNLKGYDGHFLLRKIYKFIEDEKYMYENKKGQMIKPKFSTIFKNKEQFISFQYKNLQFIDSLAFLNDSIEKLANNMTYEEKAHTINYFKKEMHLNDELIELILQKGHFFYDYFDSLEVLNQTEFPTIDKFYNKLNKKHLEPKEYEHALNVFKKLNCKNLRDYHDFYLKCDVLLLADAFENFRKHCHQNYNLEIGHYLTLPAYSFDAMLKYTKVKIELLTDEDKEQYHMFEHSIRGGYSNVGEIRYAKANNKYMKNYDENIESSFIFYIDANNLYGEAMCKPLPLNNFMTFHGENAISMEEIMNYNDDCNVGAEIMCDIHIPEDKHDLIDAYPLIMDNTKIDIKDISSYQKSLLNDKELKKLKNPCLKLTPTLNDKKDYICNIANLKYFIQMGCEVKIKKVVKYYQSRWLKPYIEFNTTMRQKAKSESEKNMYKLMNNAVFGKFLQDDRKHVDIKLITDKIKYQKCVNKLYFKGSTVLKKNKMMLIENYKKFVLLNKPVQVGTTILDRSKETMQKFYYKLKHMYGDKMKFIYTDTDSFIFQLFVEDGYEEIFKNKVNYDLSNFDKDFKTLKGNCMYDGTNEKVLGKFKLEVVNDNIVEVVAIRSKCYSYLTEKKNNKILKGIKHGVIKNEITHEDYKKCLFENYKLDVEMNTIRSKKHKIYSESIKKNALMNINDKKYILEDGIHTLTYGNKKIKELN